MLKVGLEGNIASGKSEAEKIIKDCGYYVFDLDKVVHNILKTNESVKADIYGFFHTLEREKIAKIIFSDITKKKKLESIIYPVLKEEIIEIFNKLKHESMVFVSGALITYAGFDSLLDKIIYIDATYEIQLQRLMKRNSLNVNEANLRINSQDKKAKLNADFIIENNSDLKALKMKITALLKHLEKNNK